MLLMYSSPKNKSGNKEINTGYFKGSLTKCKGKREGDKEIEIDRQPDR